MNKRYSFDFLEKRKRMYEKSRIRTNELLSEVLSRYDDNDDNTEYNRLNKRKKKLEKV